MINNNECIICLEDSSELLLDKNCNCKIIAHENCFQEWLNFNQCCPICRTHIGERRNSVIVEVRDVRCELSCCFWLMWMFFFISIIWITHNVVLVIG